MAKFQEGERVQLNSGGPIMTVGEIHDGEVVCQWFDAKNELKRATFKETLLCSREETGGSGAGYGPPPDQY